VADTRSIVAGVGRGVLAGVAGTAAMTVYQLAVARARGKPLSTPVPRTWADAPAPAQVAKRAADAVGKGRKITKKQVPLLTNVLHWAYGVGWGAAYGGVAAAVGSNAIEGGLAFGTGVWAASYGELVPLGIYKPPWAYPVEEVALDLSYHLVYGMAVAGAYASLR